MKAELFEQYTLERKAILKEYGKKKLKSCLLVLAVGVAVVAVILLAGGLWLKNVPVTAVLTLIAGIFTVLYMRIKVVTFNHALQKKLHDFEDQSLMKY